MSATDPLAAVAPEQLLALVDRAEIAGLVDRYIATLDDSCQLEQSPFDDTWSRSLFTEDATIQFPVGAHEGIEGLAELHANVMAKWDSSLHFATNRIIDLDGDAAKVRAPLIGTHIHRSDDPGDPLFAAHVLEGELVRTADGWRFCRFVFRLVWRIGDPPSGLRVDEDGAARR